MDSLLISIDNALKTLFSKPIASKSYSHANSEITQSPVNLSTINNSLTTSERQLSGALMRVNHVGEVCAQALYASQALATQNKSLKQVFHSASLDEFDHLAWTASRLDELQAHKSYLNPLWYVGAFGIGYVTGKLGGDRLSLGFVVETERQVSEHLRTHLNRLPATDSVSRDVVKQMIVDEEGHAKMAEIRGAQELPPPVKYFMRLMAKVMTTTAHHI